MFRAVPFHLRENAERGYDVLEKVLSYAAEQSLNPLGKVSGALSSFKVDVVETEAAYELFAELPGFYKEQITVSYDDDNYLRIKAQRAEAADASIKYLCRERKSGDFERTFYIDSIDKKAVNVAFENGILHIVLPKQKEEDGRTVFDIE